MTFESDIRDEQFSVYDKNNTIDEIISHITVKYGHLPNIQNGTMIDSSLRMHHNDIEKLIDGSKQISLRYPAHGALYLPFSNDHQNSRHLDCFVKDPENQEKYIQFGEIDVVDFAVSTINKLPNFVLLDTGYNSVDEAVEDLSLKNGSEVGKHDLVSVYFLRNFTSNSETQNIIDAYSTQKRYE